MLNVSERVQYGREWRKRNPNYSRLRHTRSPEAKAASATRRKTREALQHKFGVDLYAYASMLVSGAKARAKKRSLEFNLTVDWLLERLARGVCEVTGLPFVPSIGTGQQRSFLNPWAPSLDRIENSRGYTTDNVQVVVSIYNIAKGEHTDADVFRMAEALVRTHA